jgi:hypothetical protein
MKRLKPGKMKETGRRKSDQFFEFRGLPVHLIYAVGLCPDEGKTQSGF